MLSRSKAPFCYFCPSFCLKGFQTLAIAFQFLNMRKLSAAEMDRVGLSEFRGRPKTPLVLGLDNVRSALNVGSMFRTADAFALEGLALCGITACPPHRELNKTALGSTESVAWAYFPDALAAVAHYRALGYRICGAEQATGSLSLREFSPEPGVGHLLFVGNEVEGLGESLMEALDFCIEIPQWGTKHSLNVAVCAGIVSWHFAAASLHPLSASGQKDIF